MAAPATPTCTAPQDQQARETTTRKADFDALGNIYNLSSHNISDGKTFSEQFARRECLRTEETKYSTESLHTGRTFFFFSPDLVKRLLVGFFFFVAGKILLFCVQREDSCCGFGCGSVSWPAVQVTHYIFYRKSSSLTRANCFQLLPVAGVRVVRFTSGNVSMSGFFFFVRHIPGVIITGELHHASHSPSGVTQRNYGWLMFTITVGYIFFFFDSRQVLHWSRAGQWCMAGERLPSCEPYARPGHL